MISIIWLNQFLFFISCPISVFFCFFFVFFLFCFLLCFEKLQVCSCMHACNDVVCGNTMLCEKANKKAKQKCYKQKQKQNTKTIIKPFHVLIFCRRFRIESFEELGYYKLRRVSEIFAETLGQVSFICYYFCFIFIFIFFAFFLPICLLQATAFFFWGPCFRMPHFAIPKNKI